jgi:flagellar hook assembly protein FlgD
VNGATTGVAAAAPGARFALAQNAPNPFNPVTAIRFSLAGESRVELAIYDVAGRSVRTLVAEQLAAGPHEVAWDGRDDRGAPVASGLYFYKLVTPERTAVRKMVMLK